MSVVPHNFEKRLLPFIEDNMDDEDNVFTDAIRHVSRLSEVFESVKEQCMMQLKHRKRSCICDYRARMSFHHLLRKTFNDKSLYEYLTYGDDFELDAFLVDIFLDHVDFMDDIDDMAAVRAYDNVKRLCYQLRSTSQHVLGVEL